MDLEFCEKCGYQKPVEYSYNRLYPDCQDEKEREEDRENGFW